MGIIGIMGWPCPAATVVHINVAKAKAGMQLFEIQ
jgi:hypothetical protein